MAKLRDVNLKFRPSASADVVSYNLYVEPVPNQPDYDTSISYDLAQPVPDSETGKASVNLATLFADGRVEDGVYNIGIAAVDDAGNISPMDILTNVPLDFVAPDAPTETEVVRI
jgi:hypothetical protein